MTKMMNILIFFIINMTIILLLINLIPSHYKSFHPMILGSILMLFNIQLTMNLSIYLPKSWWSFISFLIIIGGLMILFLYFTSFINNMIMNIKLIFLKNFFFKIIIFLMFIMMMFMKMKNFSIWYNNIEEMNLNNQVNKIIYMYMYNMNFSILISIFYLLTSLTLLVKMLILNKYTLRKIN
uniref:NADH dehydrogenase subunit 6 n=1 Tax=Lamennaisia nobilis TaxID=2921199 RepID=UPI001F13A9CB|nr:NADH dehydrogenase subunit 6 [Lamennaisia nobilis]UML36895.1 NADH dehydrogenase subunit 6 [Lamennaisia sp.]